MTGGAAASGGQLVNPKIDWRRVRWGIDFIFAAGFGSAGKP
jgi:hypothetical protein